MIDPSELVDNLVTLLQKISALVTEMDGDTDRIYAYHDSYPTKASLAQAIHEMPHPSILAVWQGTKPGSLGGVSAWTHQITLFVRAKEETAPGTAYYDLFKSIVKGTPAGESLPMLYLQVHDSCYPMDVPSISRQTDAEGLDYFEIPLSFTEAGDE